MKPLPYRQAFDRIRAEFLDMPGMQLTPAQVERLACVESGICKTVLDDLVRARFLCITANGTYCRRSGGATDAGLNTTESEGMSRPSAERRAS